MTDPDPTPGTDHATTPVKREREGGRLVLLLVLGLAAIGGATWAAAYAVAGDKVPRGTTVEGVAVGGRTSAGAAKALAEGLSPRTESSITLQVGGKSRSVTPAMAGLTVDYAASVADAGGEQSWDPQRLWNYFTGGDELSAVVDVDESAMDGLLDELTSQYGTSARDGAISFTGARVQVRDPVQGQEVDPDQAREALVAAFLASDSTAELTLRPVEPEIDQADVQEALDEFANPAVSGPVTLVFGESPVQLRPAEFSPVLAMSAEDGRLVPDLRVTKLRALVDEAVGDEGEPVDATVRLVDGTPQVIPAKPGVSYRKGAVSDAFLKLVTRPEGKRTMKVEATVAKPDFTTADARDLKIVEQVSTFTTSYPHADYRNTNIGRAAELVDGTLLRPGETFSMNDTVGERTRENGFTEGFIIADGILKEDLGGGVSQLATTLFNAMFFAGLKDIEHRPHSFYISRYPVGREATVVWGALDLRFQNDTPYGVLVDTSHSPSSPGGTGSVTVTMYSTKYWDIDSATSERYAFTEPETRRLSGPDCTPNEGYGGFQIDVTRFFRKAGQDALDHQEVFHTTYTPSDSVVCTDG